MNKNGLAASMLVIIVLLMVAFIAILYFIFVAMPSSDQIDKQVCRQSVINRATFNWEGKWEPGRNIIPLSCKTEKICFAENSRSNFCETTFGTINKENRVDVISNPKKYEVMDRFAEALYDCHWQLGEGKVNFMPREFTETNYCVICSRIILDDVSYNLVKDVGIEEWYYFLYNKKNREGTSYLEFIYGVNSPAIATLALGPLNENLKSKGRISDEIDLSAFNPFKQDNAIIAMQSTQGKWAQYLTTGGTASLGVVATGMVVSTIITGGTSLFVTVPIAMGVISTGTLATGGGAAYVYVTSSPHNSNYATPVILEYKPSDLRSAFDCDSFENLP